MNDFIKEQLAQFFLMMYAGIISMTILHIYLKYKNKSRLSNTLKIVCNVLIWVLIALISVAIFKYVANGSISVQTVLGYILGFWFCAKQFYG